MLEAKQSKQRNTDAICISTYNQIDKEVSSRYVNLKYIKGNKWYFFSNYSSKKALDIERNNQISALVFWPETSTQIRIKANIFKATIEESDEHFQKRSIEKNALAISSKQSDYIDSFDEVKTNFFRTLETLKEKNSFERPSYWGGYYFIPYYFEFWNGHHNRLNKRKAYQSFENDWKLYYLQP